MLLAAQEWVRTDCNQDAWFFGRADLHRWLGLFARVPPKKVPVRTSQQPVIKTSRDGGMGFSIYDHLGLMTSSIRPAQCQMAIKVVLATVFKFGFVGSMRRRF